MRPHTLTRKNFGFALVATVSMMVLLTLVAIAMLSLSTIEQRSSGGGANDADRMARANARMALMMALGELQKAAGLDQRVSATASILGDSSNNNYAGGTTAANGRKHWLGVWDTSSYSPATPDAKTFVRWPDPDGPDSVKVPKVEVATTSGNTSYYAYWVEDEGVKTDLKWEEVDAASASDEDEERAQARRLSAAAAPNYWLTTGGGALGPFRDPNDDGSATDAIGSFRHGYRFSF